MRKLLTYALAGVAGAALAGAAIAAEQPTRTMNVPLADGSTVTIRYVGDVAPTVRVVPAPRGSQRLSRWMFPDFADFDRIFADMNRRHAELMRRMQSLPRQPLGGGPGLNLASTGGSLPEGSSSVSVVTVSNGGKTCTRTTEVVSQGAGKPPKVTTGVSGDCGPEAGSEPKPATLSHT